MGKGNQQKISNNYRVGPHLGFKVNKKILNYLYHLTKKFKTMMVKKPDEISLFIELPCGEVIEFSG